MDLKKTLPKKTYAIVSFGNIICHLRVDEVFAAINKESLVFTVCRGE